MGQRSYACRHCGETFIPYPGKPGYVDECAECLTAKELEAQPKAPSQLQQLLEYISEHPVYVDAAGNPVRWKTRLELRNKLRRKGLSEEVVEKLAGAYMSAYVAGVK